MDQHADVYVSTTILELCICFYLWHTEELQWRSCHSDAAGEALSTLATKLRAFRVLFGELVRLFGLDLEETSLRPFVCRGRMAQLAQLQRFIRPDVVCPFQRRGIWHLAHWP